MSLNYFQQDAVWRHIKRKDFNESAWESRKDLTPEERVKLAFAEGFVEGQSRKNPNRVKQLFKGIQSFVAVVVLAFLVLFLLGASNRNYLLSSFKKKTKKKFTHIYKNSHTSFS